MCTLEVFSATVLTASAADFPRSPLDRTKSLPTLGEVGPLINKMEQPSGSILLSPKIAKSFSCCLDFGWHIPGSGRESAHGKTT